MGGKEWEKMGKKCLGGRWVHLSFLGQDHGLGHCSGRRSETDLKPYHGCSGMSARYHVAL